MLAEDNLSAIHDLSRSGLCEPSLPPRKMSSVLSYLSYAFELTLE